MTGRAVAPLAARRRGFTVVEILVAATLAVGLGALVGLALSATSSATKSSLLRSAAEREVREISDEFTQYVRAAQPPLACEDPSGEVAIANCVSLVRTGAAFVEAQADRVVFFTRTDGIADAASALELLTMEVEESPEGSLLRVERRLCAQDVLRCQDPSAYGTSELLRTLTLSSRPRTSPGPVFEFVTATGETVCATASCSSEELARIAMVRFDPSVVLDLDSGPFTVGLPVFVALSGGQDAL